MSIRHSCTSRCARVRRRSTRCRCSPAGKANPCDRRRTRGGLTAAILRSPVRISRQSDPQPTGQILHVLPGNTARARAARGCPFERLALEFFAAEGDAVVVHVAGNHGQILVLAAAVEAEPKPEAV